MDILLIIVVFLIVGGIYLIVVSSILERQRKRQLRELAKKQLIKDKNNEIIESSLFSSDLNLSLEEKIRISQGKKDKNPISNVLNSSRIKLKELGKSSKYHLFLISSFACAAFCGFAGYLLDNMFFILPFSIIGWLLPSLILNKIYKKHEDEIERDLQHACSLITSSYKRTNNIVVSVEESLESIHPTVFNVFNEFLTESKLVNANLLIALNNLKNKVDNRIFKRWVDQLITCQTEPLSKDVLTNITKEFTDKLRIQKKLESEAHSSVSQVYIMSVFAFLSPYIIKLCNSEWGDLYLNNTIGKLIIAITYSITIIIMLISSKIAKPMEFRGEGYND